MIHWAMIFRKVLFGRRRRRHGKALAHADRDGHRTLAAAVRFQDGTSGTRLRGDQGPCHLT